VSRFFLCISHPPPARRYTILRHSLENEDADEVDNTDAVLHAALAAPKDGSGSNGAGAPFVQSPAAMFAVLRKVGQLIHCENSLRHSASGHGVN
jgi:hypothetical protein